MVPTGPGLESDCHVSGRRESVLACLYPGVGWMELLKRVLIQNMLAFDSKQLDNGALPSMVNGSTFPSGSGLPGPPKITVAG